MKRWNLDTNSAGRDEILDGDIREEVIDGVSHHHDIQELPRAVGGRGNKAPDIARSFRGNSETYLIARIKRGD